MPVLRYLETAIHRGASLPSESCEIKRSCCSNFGEQRLNAFAERDSQLNGWKRRVINCPSRMHGVCSIAGKRSLHGYLLSFASRLRFLAGRQHGLVRAPPLIRR
jgi:hypothetical protein